jgi:hypothetical protein
MADVRRYQQDTYTSLLRLQRGPGRMRKQESSGRG